MIDDIIGEVGGVAVEAAVETAGGVFAGVGEFVTGLAGEAVVETAADASELIDGGSNKKQEVEDQSGQPQSEI